MIERPRDTPESLAATLLNAAYGTAEGLACSRLSHGSNNRTYKVATKRGACLLKIYFRHRDDTRDRLAAEWGFLSFCAAHGLDAIPHPLACDAEAGAALFSWIEGRSLMGSHPEKRHLEQAANFLGELARLSAEPEARALPPAAEACASRQTHLEVARRRVRALLHCLQHQERDELARDAASFVREALAPCLEKAERAVLRCCDEAWLQRPLRPDETLLSPSDFGFHNALDTPHGLVFVDFEYAGRDDPLKTVCDFLCQPAVPVSEDCLPLLARALSPVAEPRALAEKCAVFLPLHRIKWCCIMLNIFHGADNQRRAFADVDGQNTRTRRAGQLAKAKAYFTRHLQRI